ncbi:MAG: F0F1 ATP synthase subunit epsilon [Pyrinomonadaceae bacterium]
MLKLEIVTPEKKVFDETVDAVTVPTSTGEVGLLPNHASLVSTLKPGVLSFVVKGQTEKIAVSGGFVEMSNNTVSVLADTAETAAEIDVETAKSEREAAEKVLGVHTNSIEETIVAQDKLEAANARLQLAGK